MRFNPAWCIRLLLLFAVLANNGLQAQDLSRKINVGFKDVTLPETIGKLEKLSGCHIYYRKEEIKDFPPVNLEEGFRTVMQVLTEVFAGKPFSLKQIGNNILVEELKPLDRIVTGRAICATSKVPLPYAYVEVTSPENKYFLKQQYTDTTGRFSFSGIPDSLDLLIRLSVMGYKDYLLKKPASPTSHIQLGDVALEPDIKKLKEVVVTAAPPVIERRADRFVINTGSSSIAAASSVWDALSRTPLINASEGGSLSIIGRQAAVVYINGRKSNLSDEALYNYLKSLPVGNVKNIEIITSPGSEYEASGNSGIININFKKRESDGWLGTAMLAGVQQTYYSQRANTALNFRKGKLGWNLIVYGNRLHQKITENSIVDFFKPGAHGIANPTDAVRPEIKRFVGGNLSSDYSINDRQLLSAAVDYNHNRHDLGSRTTSSFINSGTGHVDSAFFSDNQRKVKGSTFDLNLNYRVFTGTAGESINISADFFKFLSVSDQHLVARLLSSNIKRQDELAFLNQDIKNYTVAADYVKPLWKGIFKAGMRSFNTTTENALDYRINDGSGHYIADALRSSHYEYTERVNAVYFSFGKTFSKKVSTTAGLRLEQSNTHGIETSHPDIVVNRNYTSFFPNLSISYAKDKDHQFSYSLTRRVNRPSFGQLNTNRIYYNPTRYAEGNPFLQPSYILKNEIIYTLRSKYIFIASYSHTKDAYSQFVLTNDTTNEVRFTQLNYGSSNEANLAFVATLALGKFASTSLTLIGNYSNYGGNANGEAIDNSGFSGTVKSNSTFLLSKEKKWTAYLDLSYTTRKVLSLSNDGIVRPMGSIEAGIRKTIKQFTLIVYGTDLLKTSANRYVFTNRNTANYFRTYYDNRGLELSVRYGFGNAKVKKTQSRESINRDIINRSGN